MATDKGPTREGKMWKQALGEAVSTPAPVQTSCCDDVCVPLVAIETGFFLLTPIPFAVCLASHFFNEIKYVVKCA